MNGYFRSKLFLDFALCVAIAVGTPAAASDRSSLDGLGFLEGHWAGSSGRVEMEEIWIGPNGGVMLGLHRDVAPGRSTFFEYLRIEDREGTVAYVANPRGEGATSFLLLSLEGQQAVFENLEHDFPQRIVYRRDGERLTVRIEGMVDGELQSKEWVWELEE